MASLIRQTRNEIHPMTTLERPALLALLSELRGRTLACWCAPLLCHAGVLAELADSGP